MRKTFFQKTLNVSNNLEEEYINIIRCKDKDFTRKRKITPSDLFLQMIANKGLSQKNEILEFYSEVQKSMDISATAFFNARLKFNPEALLKIMQDLTIEEYVNPEILTTLKDYYILAVDGSDVSLPTTDETREIYGKSTNQFKTKTDTVLASISTIYDCINELFLDVQINHYKYSENLTASEHLNTIKEILPSNTKYLTIFDRFYANIRLIDQMVQNNQYFLIRLPGNSFKKEQEVLSAETPDCWINIVYDTARINYYRNDYEFSERLRNTKYNLRFVRLYFKDSAGSEKYNTFITNLPNEDFSTEEINDLYHLRWKIETSYRSLKSQITMENFSGLRDMLIRQDIYAAAFVHNIVSMTVAESECSHQELPQKNYKHEMKINRNFALGVLKKDILKIFVLYRDKKAVKAARKQFEENIIKYSCPIREGRSNPRKIVGNLKNKHSYKKSY